MRVTIVDAGPLIAFLSHTDKNHIWAGETFDALSGQVMTCEAVISEASFIVARNGKKRSAIVELVDRLGIEVKSLGSELQMLRVLMEKYSSVPMSFADACLVRLSEMHADSVVFTCDSDFSTYRKNTRKIIQTLSP
jgi:uncharacterized protein